VVMVYISITVRYASLWDRTLTL